jgi:hypothetical protein
MSLEGILGQCNHIFREHKPIMEKEYGLDLSGYYFVPGDYWETDGKPVLMGINMIDRSICVNWKAFQDISDKFDFVPGWLEEKGFYEYSLLAMTVAHECFHTLIPQEDKNKLFRSTKIISNKDLLFPSRSLISWIRNPIKQINDIRRHKTVYERLKKELEHDETKSVQEVIADFCSHMYIEGYCIKGRAMIEIENRCGMMFGSYKKKRDNDAMIYGYMLHYNNDSRDYYKKDGHEGAKVYAILEDIYRKDGFKGIVEEIRDPKRILDRKAS